MSDSPRLPENTDASVFAASAPQTGTSAAQNMPRRRSWRFRLLAGLTVAAMVLCVMELGVRLLVPDGGSRRFRQINQIVLFLGTHESDLMLDADPQRFWKLKPNVRIEDTTNEFWQGRVSNSLGFRNPEFALARQPRSLRVVCFGDSSTFGIGNRMAETWPAQLESQLRQASWARDYAAIEVINAGVPGYSSWQGLQHMRQEIGRLQPDIVLASYANNDFWHWDDTTDRNHAGQFEESLLRQLLLHSRLVRLMDTGIARIKTPAASELEAPSPNQTWAAAATVNYVSPVPQWVRRVPLDDFRDNVEHMAALCRQHGAICIPVKWPDQPLAAGQPSPREDYHAILTAVAAEQRLYVADVVAEFQRHQPWSVDTYIPNDIVHVNRAGNALAATAAFHAVCDALQRSAVPLSTN